MERGSIPLVTHHFERTEKKKGGKLYCEIDQKMYVIKYIDVIKSFLILININLKGTLCQKKKKKRKKWDGVKT